MSDDYETLASDLKNNPRIDRVTRAILTARGEGLDWPSIVIASVAAMDGVRRIQLHQAFADFVQAGDGHWELVMLAIWWARKLERLREDEARVADPTVS